MIGDNPDADCRPVCAMGMKAVLVRGTRSGQFDCEATGLLEALDLIGCSAEIGDYGDNGSQKRSNGANGGIGKKN